MRQQDGKGERVGNGELKPASMESALWWDSDPESRFYRMSECRHCGMYPADCVAKSHAAVEKLAPEALEEERTRAYYRGGCCANCVH